MQTKINDKMEFCNCEHCIKNTFHYHDDEGHVNTDEVSYCICFECFKEEILDDILDGDLDSIEQLEESGYLFDMVINHDEERRVKLIFKTLIDKAFEKIQYEDDASTVEFLDYFFYETDIIQEHSEVIEYALGYLHDKIKTLEDYTVANGIHNYFIQKLVWCYLTLEENEKDKKFIELLTKSLKIATLTGDTRTIHLILDKRTQTIVEKISNKQHLEELDQLFWAPGGIRYFEIEKNFNQLKQLTI